MSTPGPDSLILRRAVWEHRGYGRTVRKAPSCSLCPVLGLRSMPRAQQNASYEPSRTLCFLPMAPVHKKHPRLSKCVATWLLDSEKGTVLALQAWRAHTGPGPPAAPTPATRLMSGSPASQGHKSRCKVVNTEGTPRRLQ